MPNNNEGAPKPVPWAKSKAKELLRNDIILGKVNERVNAQEVYLMRPQYKDYAMDKFRTNLGNLIKAVRKDIERMRKDCEAYGHDRAVLAEQRCDIDESRTFNSWHQSEARELLKVDMELGLHKEMKPKEELWLSRQQYQAFELEVFRKAIYAAVDKKDKMRFRMEMKKIRAPAPQPSSDDWVSVSHDDIPQGRRN